MKYIQLPQGKQAIVDDEDYEMLLDYPSWHFCNGYASCLTLKKYGKRKRLYMHQVLVNAPDDLVIDHINQNKLDNRRKNLRAVTRSLNALNNKNNIGLYDLH